ncbi:hypothetical protein I6A84_24070 [Frankia sp. CNm7]|uniref:Uncharacterized protein n=1 Tax=Frankia nepalensis TaxID=1836974 RepID=A0A937UQ26_9ACTN|nr:hypothetical protein [Frankia nepalensis]MBL7495833.1 hypothetical protein [Frankia nepalensis]MBL7509909.1 hypothetical protein [Frankia nepalensis]MBL7521081.1 hypothetical protein [Frankia nepalensis]MBL7629668.1 hypothetical protein [Frankia nepalensis]
MSDDVLSVIPTDPWWQPEASQAERARGLVTTLVPWNPDSIEPEVSLTWHESVALVDCGANLERITCPRCENEVDTDWWRALLDDRYEDGFNDLSAVLPCCGRQSSLADLHYDWPCGFARFEIEIWNPGRSWLTEGELAAIAAEIGHPVRQVMAHI